MLCAIPSPPLQPAEAATALLAAAGLHPAHLPLPPCHPPLPPCTLPLSLFRPSAATPTHATATLHTTGGAEKVQELIEDAVAKGAKMLAGGKAASISGGQFFQPTVLTGIDKSMKIWTEEVFGPVSHTSAAGYNRTCDASCMQHA
jgi:hypothetical protein